MDIKHTHAGTHTAHTNELKDPKPNPTLDMKVATGARAETADTGPTRTPVHVGWVHGWVYLGRWVDGW